MRILGELRPLVCIMDYTIKVENPPPINQNDLVVFAIIGANKGRATLTHIMQLNIYDE